MKFQHGENSNKSYIPTVYTSYMATYVRHKFQEVKRSILKIFYKYNNYLYSLYVKKLIPFYIQLVYSHVECRTLKYY